MANTFASLSVNSAKPSSAQSGDCFVRKVHSLAMTFCCHCERSEAVSLSYLEIASVAECTLSQWQFVVTANEVKQSLSRTWRWLRSQRTLSRNDSLLSLRTKWSSLHLVLGDCFVRKVRSLAMTVCCHCERSEAVSHSYLEIASFAKCALSQWQFVVTANEVKQSPSRTWRWLRSQECSFPMKAVLIYYNKIIFSLPEINHR